MTSPTLLILAPNKNAKPHPEKFITFHGHGNNSADDVA